MAVSRQCPRFSQPPFGREGRWALHVCPHTWSVPVDVSGLGVRGACVRARAWAVPTPRSPAVHRFPLLGFKLFSGFLQQRLLAALLSLTSGGPSSCEGEGQDWWVGGNPSAWRLARARTGRSVLDTLTGP